MKTTITFLYVLLNFHFLVFAQLDKPDQINATEGQISIQPVLHSTLVLTWNNKTIYVDPYGGANLFIDIAAPDLILITDIHGDHMNLETLNAIETKKAIVVAPQTVKDQLPELLKDKTVVLSNGNQTTQLGIAIMAVPMYNLPESAESRHPKGRGNGYVLNLGGKNIYISGDTEDIPEMRALKNIDIAFVCMNQPFTMTVEQPLAQFLILNRRLYTHFIFEEGMA